MNIKKIFFLTFFCVTVFFLFAVPPAGTRTKETTQNYGAKADGIGSANFSDSEKVTATEMEIDEAKKLGARYGAEDGKMNNNRSRSRNPYNHTDPCYDAFMSAYRTAFSSNSDSGSIKWYDTGHW